MILKLIALLLPWPLRRHALINWFGYKIDPTARIGFSWIFPKNLVMEAGARIDHLTIAINLTQMHMGVNSSIGRGNWITGFSTQIGSRHFQHQPERRAELLIGESAAITKYHHLDCTNLIEIGAFTTIAGYHSQFLTHSIDIIENRQDSAPIRIGAYAFIGTNVVILGGGILPSYSVLGAKSLLNKAYEEEYMLYGGVPARQLQPIPQTARYFSRTDGFVY